MSWHSCVMAMRKLYHIYIYDETLQDKVRTQLILTTINNAWNFQHAWNLWCKLFSFIHRINYWSSIEKESYKPKVTKAVQYTTWHDRVVFSSSRKKVADSVITVWAPRTKRNVLRHLEIFEVTAKMDSHSSPESGMFENTTEELWTSITMATTPEYKYVIPASAVLSLSVFSLLIICCNVIVLLVYTLTNTLRVPVSVHMKSLACADLWVGVNCAVNIAFTLNNGRWPFSLFLCKLVAYLLVVSVGVSVTSLTVISVDRYLAICHPMRYRNIMSQPKARFISVMVWILTLLLYLPSNFDWFRRDQAADCTQHFRMNISISFFVIAITIIPNLIVSCLSYTLIVGTLTRRHKWLRKTTENGMHPNSDSVKARHREQDKLMAKIGLAILSAFYITWLPYMVFGTVRQLGLGRPSQTAINLSLYLGISNSFLNCFIYSIANKAFRNGVKILFKRLCCCRWRRGFTVTGSSNLTVKTSSSEENRRQGIVKLNEVEWQTQI